MVCPYAGPRAVAVVEMALARTRVSSAPFIPTTDAAPAAMRAGTAVAANSAMAMPQNLTAWKPPPAQGMNAPRPDGPPPPPPPPPPPSPSAACSGCGSGGDAGTPAASPAPQGGQRGELVPVQGIQGALQRREVSQRRPHVQVNPDPLAAQAAQL